MSRNLWLATWLMIVTTAAGAEVAQKLAEGDAALLKFDLQAGLTAYRQAVQLSPDTYEANWKLARSLADQGTLTKDRAQQKTLYVEAEQLARKAVAMNPADSKGHVYLAIAVGKVALYEGGKRKVELSKEVKAEAEKAVALNPKEDLGFHVLGIWNREMADLNWALRTFAEFLYGEFPPASRDQAIAHLKRATELAPNVVAHHAELGITLASPRHWSEAKTELDKALALPKAWVTDDYYRTLAKQALERVNAHLR